MDLKILKELEGPRGGRASFAGHGNIVPTQELHYSISVSYVNDYLYGVEGKGVKVPGKMKRATKKSGTRRGRKSERGFAANPV